MSGSDSGRDSPITSYMDDAVAGRGNFDVYSDNQFQRKIQHVDEVMMTLQQSYDPQRLATAMKRIIDDVEDVTKREYMEENLAHLSVLEVMRHLASHTDIQQIGFQILCKFLDKSTLLRENLQHSDAYKHVLRVIYEHISDVNIQTLGMQILALLLRSEHLRMQILLDDKLAEVMDAITVAVTGFRDNCLIQTYAIMALNQVLTDDFAQQESFMSVEFNFVMDSLNLNCRESSVVQQTFLLLHTLSKNDSICQRLVEDHDIQDVVMKMTKDFLSNEDVLQTGLILLAALSKEENVQYLLVKSGYISEVVSSTMLKLPANVKIQLAGLTIADNTAATMFGSISGSNQGYTWLKNVYYAMSKHIERADIQVMCNTLLVKLTKYCPELCQWIGEDREERQDPIHTLVLGTLLMYGKNKDICESACDAIYWLCADNESICKLLMDKNVFIAIVERMKSFRHEPRIVEACCKGLRGLCIFCEKNKERVSEYNTLSYLIPLAESYSFDHGVLLEIFALIACLADISDVRNQCIREGVQRKVLAAMDSVQYSPILHEVAIETLTVLCGAASGPQALNFSETLRRLMNSMSHFSNNLCIQKKGLILMQLLADENELESEDQCRRLAKTIDEAMSRFRDNLSVQAEGCVALQLLSEKSELMSCMVVEQGCHQTLFRLMSQTEASTGIPDLSSECLYNLGIVGNLNSKMLLSMCGHGPLEAVECLVEIGADVNYGQGQKTPLCLACQRNDEDMVRFLLKQGISDIQTALKLSMENQSHMITGLLLKFLGHDREGGIVSWSNLGLGDLQPEWLAPTVVEELITPEMSDAGRKMAMKVKSSEERIEKRMYFLRDRSHSFDHNLFRYPKERSDGVGHAYSNSDLGPGGTSTMTKRIVVPSNSKRPSIKRLFPSKRALGGSSDLPQSRDITPVGTPTEDKFLTDDAETCPSFQLMDGEYEEWKNTTLSGSNVPYNLNDPRLTPEQILVPTTSRISQAFWKRKDISQDDSPALGGPNIFPNLTVSSESGYFSLSSGVPRPRRGRRPSLPAIPTFSEVPAPAKISRQRRASRGALGSITEKTFEELSAAFRKKKQEGSDPELPITDLARRSTLFVPVPTSNINPEEDSVNKKRSNTLGSLPSSVPVETRVTCLDVSANNIRYLTYLVLAGSGLMESMSSLEKLDLSKNYLEDIPTEFLKYLRELKCLDLKSNNLDIFPIGVFQCANLTILDLSHNKIGAISSHMFGASFAIRELNLSYNQLPEFPMWVGECMPGLEKLNLAGNKIQSLPESPLMLKRLKRLDFSHNFVRHIPEIFLTECNRLETLEAMNNQLEKLPSEDVAKHLVRLNKLRLSKNNLTEKDPLFVPKFILELPSLRSVNLTENGLQGLPPPGLWKTSLLKELMVSRNNIRELNLENCGKAWPCLETFHIAHNQLSELPKEIGNLTSLSSLFFNHNKSLTTLPDELGRCSKLWEMPLDGLMLDLDQALLKSRVKDLIIYLHHKLKKARRHYRMKMIVVGYGGKGKSTLLRSLVRKKQPEKSVATVGILVGDWKYERKTREGKVQQYTLSTWDFAGQEDFYSSHQCFLSNRALYLVVYKLNGGEKEINQLKPWLLNIQSRAPGCPVVVVGTHVDQLPSESRAGIIQDMRERIGNLITNPGFPQLLGLIEIDATSRDSSSMDRLRNLVKMVVDEYKIRGQPVMGQKIPASYVRLAELITEEAKSLSASYPVIRHNKMKKIVKQSELDMDEEELQQAVRFLHEWGILIHYNDSTLQLKDLYFIDPGWLCRMMAQVITVREINPFITKNGLMKKSNVKMLFTGRVVDGEVHYTFPPSLIPQYLRLLEKFEIALPQNDEDLLIPCRLPVQKPGITIPKSEKTGGITREYHMPYIPMGFWARLLARLIVFCHKMAEKNSMVYWRQGIYVHWSDDKYFLLQPTGGDRDCFQILVPASRGGSSLMGIVVDHVDALIEEWFPGLTTVDPILGRELLQKFVPCSFCKGIDPHLFPLGELLEIADSQTTVHCPGHNGEVPLSLLAPDIVLSDMELKYKLDSDQFIYVPSPQYLIGDGGFGSVYSAQYRGQVVAVKTFNIGQVGEIHPHKLLRQEATILSKLRHPGVISLLAVEIKPRVMVIEFAPLGSLGGLLKAHHSLSRGLQHRISLQVSEGLAYLHDNMIMYRDMKPDNILLFNLSLSNQINVKLSDYGISRLATLYGLTLQEGTLGYRAPEVARGETYSFSADIFSLGITLYELMSGGNHPFEDLEYRCEMDKAIVEGKPIPPLKGAAPWPDMQDLVTDTIQQIPDRRPLARMVYDRLTSPELLCLKQVIPISSGVTVESIAIRSSGEDNRLEAWIGSGDKDCVQLSWISLAGTKKEVQGMIFSDSRILCLLALGTGYVLVGTQSGRVWVYDAWQYRCKHSLPQLTDAVLCMQVVQGNNGEESLLAGLADGKLAVFPVSEVLQNADTYPTMFDLGHDYEPIKCICQHNGKLYVSCGANIFCLRYDYKVAIETMWNTAGESNNRGSTITNMVMGKFLFISKKGSSIVESWDMTREKLRDMADIVNVLGLVDDVVDVARVTALSLQNSKVLWVGTGGGHVILLDGATLKPLITTHRYTSSVRCITVTRPTENFKSSIVLTGGLGFRSRSKFDIAKEDQFGCLAVWDGDFANQIKTMREDLKKRQDIVEKYSSPNE